MPISALTRGRAKNMKKSNKTIIIAEMACSHDGSMEIAKKIIDAAADAKADVINFHMTHLPDYMVPDYNLGGVSEGKDSNNIYNYLKKIIWFGEKEWRGLFSYAKKKNLLVSALCNDISSLETAKKLNADIYQIHSSSLSEKNLVKLIAKNKKQIALKIGGTYLGELEKCISWIKEEGNENIVLMYGYQNYPTKLEDVNMRFIPTLKNLFNLPVGFCDHTDGVSELALIIPLLSLPFGATFLEKHITHDRSKKCEDFESALNPDDFKKFVGYVRESEKTFGISSMRLFSEDEQKYRNISKKRAVANANLSKGTVLQQKHIAYKRANSGLFPDKASSLMGRKLKKDISENTPIDWSCIE